MKTTKKGFGLVEIIVGISIISAVIFSLGAVSDLGLKLIEANTKSSQAAYLLEEGIEALRTLRDSGWATNISALTPDTFYYLYFSNDEWKATSTNIFIDSTFERKFMAQNVYRDPSTEDIAYFSQGNVLDLDTKKITVSVSWRSRTSTTTKTLSTYFTNIFAN